VATDIAITIFLEGSRASAGDTGERGGAAVRFDDVALVAIQPFCPETPPEEVPTERCVDVRDLRPGTELPPVYEKEGFKFTSLDRQPLRVVGFGAPPGESKLALGERGILVELPFVAARVRVEVSVNTRSPVYLFAMSSSGEPAGHTTTTGGEGLRVLELAADDVRYLQIGGKGGEDALYRICATPALPDPSRGLVRAGGRPLLEAGPRGALPPARALSPPHPDEA